MLSVGRARLLVWVAAASCVPYLVFKGLWLGGRRIGITSAAGATEMTSARFVAGNSVTIVLECCAIALAFALTRPWGRQLPAPVVLLPMWVATGLLTPIVLGLPAGLVLQALSGGSPIPQGQDLSWWVFAVVYGGFTLLGVCLAAIFVCYARDRWPDTVGAAPATPRGAFALSCLVVIACYAVALVLWSIGGTHWGGPAGFDTLAQRTVLAVTGVLTASGVLAMIRPVSKRVRPRRTVVALWVGTSVSVLSGPTHVLLSNRGHPGIPQLISASLAAAAGLIVTRNILQQRQKRLPVAPAPLSSSPR